MKRRKLIKVAFYSTSGIALSSILPGCKGDVLEIDTANYTSDIFAKNDFEFLKSFADILLPSSDTPGAKSTGLVQIMDKIEGAILDKDQLDLLSKNVSVLNTYFASQSDGTSLIDLDDTKGVELVTTIDKSLSSGDADIHKAYKSVKQKLVHYFLNTEEVGTELLNYLPVPGEYQACISLDEVGGKAWTI
jgi:hypothetical protein